MSTRPNPFDVITAPPPASAFTRGYRRGFDYTYQGPPPPPDTGANLVPVMWDQLPLNGGDDPNTGLCSVVENVEGWLDSPPLDGHDEPRAVADGSAWGPKTLGARVVTITGAATGPRDMLGWLRDQLAMRAAAREPAPLAITDAAGSGRTLTADVRAGTDAFRHTWLGHTGIRWSVVLTAADARLYEDTWQTASLVTSLPGGTGRTYQRTFGWQYASPYLPNSALLPNDGNVAAPVWALYTGDLSASQLADEAGNVINLDVLNAGMHVLVDTSTLAATAEGGVSRAAYVLPGSVPMLLPPAVTSRWHLYATGAGSIDLAWRSAWV